MLFITHTSSSLFVMIRCKEDVFIVILKCWVQKSVLFHFPLLIFLKCSVIFHLSSLTSSALSVFLFLKPDTNLLDDLFLLSVFSYLSYPLSFLLDISSSALTSFISWQSPNHSVFKVSDRLTVIPLTWGEIISFLIPADISIHFK